MGSRSRIPISSSLRGFTPGTLACMAEPGELRWRSTGKQAENLSSTPRVCVRKDSAVGYACNPSAGAVDTDRTRASRLPVSSRPAREGHYLTILHTLPPQKKKATPKEHSPRLFSGFPTCIHGKHIHTHTHHTHIHIYTYTHACTYTQMCVRVSTSV